MTDKKEVPEVIRRLGEISGVGVVRTNEILEEVRANLARLNGCAGPHDFQPIDEGQRLSRKARCSKCAGEVRTSDWHWYERAMEHVRADIEQQIEALWADHKKWPLDDADDPAYGIIEGLKRAYQATGKSWEPKK
jgi:hypothetical protein